MKFNSQICTTKIQSERLLVLGLKAETADMVLLKELAYDEKRHCLCDADTYMIRPIDYLNGEEHRGNIPAWSLHRLLELFIEVNGNFLDWEFEISPGKLIIRRSNRMMFVWSKNVYDSIITCIEWLIKSGYFNKKYLDELCSKH